MNGEVPAKQPLWSVETRRRVRNITFIVGCMVVMALLFSAIAWVTTGSRTQALQTLVVTFLGELAALCFVALVLGFVVWVEDES